MAHRYLSFNRPHLTGRELDYIQEAVAHGQLAGNGLFTNRCHQWLQREVGCARALLTHSCTGALEMAALLLDIQPGDEIVMPSYTFVSTANAFVLRGGVPVFVDIRPDTLNIDEQLIEAALTSRTRAIVAVHYAGVGCEMPEILAIARRHGALVVEDAAQALGASYGGRPLGQFGELAAISFHETKNVIAGEGGALLVNDARFVERAEIIWEKGTNRSRFRAGLVDKYSWVDLGSSFLPGELTAAFLWAQLEHADSILATRRRLWQAYADALAPLEARERLRCPSVPVHCEHNGHLFYVLLPEARMRGPLLDQLEQNGINAVFHYVPLHSSDAGRRFARTHGEMARTDDLSARLVRLPLWTGMGLSDVERVVDVIRSALD